MPHEKAIWLAAWSQATQRERAALRKYGRHKKMYVVDGAGMKEVPNCDWYDGKPCTCGLTAAQREGTDA